MKIRDMVALFTTALICGFCATVSAAQQPNQPRSNKKASLNAFLKQYVKQDDGGPDPTVRYSSTFVDLKDDGNQEAVVYIVGREWCGSGGCPLLILEPQGTTYRVITKTSVTQLPIRMLTTKTNGWHDIGVIVAGGGIIPGYEAKLSFNGRKYPSNPTVAPARPLKRTVPGRVLISRDAPQTPLNQ